jgi:NAD(P)H-dependent FMN reductase
LPALARGHGAIRIRGYRRLVAPLQYDDADIDARTPDGWALPEHEQEIATVAKPVLRIIIGSTRPGRVGPTVADWIERRAQEHGGFDVQVSDLAEVSLPLFDEPNHPRMQQYVHQHTKDWSALVAGGDAFIFVTPEYNYGFNAALKNAIDYLHNEWTNKAAGIVSYGGVSAGTRATQMLKQVLSSLRIMVVTDAVNIPFVRSLIDEDGRFKPNEVVDASATAMLDELLRWTEALRPLRSA